MFRCTVTPPTFKDRTSYQFFQREEFVVLSALEGKEVAGQAIVHAKLERKTSSGTNVLVWARPLIGCTIPTEVTVVASNNVVCVVVAGKYGATEFPSGVPFSIYDIEGRRVTNGWHEFQAKGNLSWHLFGDMAALRDKAGNVLFGCRIGRAATVVSEVP
jgi:hypothetical protein